jgi:hypothetical protein
VPPRKHGAPQREKRRFVRPPITGCD